MSKEFNLSSLDFVKVKLTETGINELYRRREQLNEHIVQNGGKPVGPYEIVTDEEGYTKFQFWVFMNNLGHLMGLAAQHPIKGDIIVLKN